MGIKDGKIFEIGKAGNPDVQDKVDIVIGASTEIIAGEGHILTAGAIDTHIHFICPQQIETALASGITTMLGGGTVLQLAQMLLLVLLVLFIFLECFNLQKHFP